MKIVVIGPAYPYRGLALVNEMLARSLAAKGHQVHMITFTMQYPRWLFPGKTQYSDSPPPDDLRITRMIHSINPFNWWKTGRKIREMHPDMVIVRYWTPMLAPCFGTICRIVGKNRHTAIISNLDNVIPHESHFYDALFTRYFLSAVDGFLYMSNKVKEDLDRFPHASPCIFAPHPVFSNFGDKLNRITACSHLQLDPDCRYLLFFGLIRAYKGLDLLLDAWALWKKQGGTAKRKLIVAGEFYTPPDKYHEQMRRLGIQDDVLLHDRFIRNEEVKYYFSAADVLVQPYKSGTQSGVTQIAYQFEVPMIVTRVGGLAEMVPDGKTGYVVPPSAEALAQAMSDIFSNGTLRRFEANMKTEKQRFSWDFFVDQIILLYGKITKSATI
ncbi:MAG: glycosyltransferase family 4 protein [Bacteroidales bacterium]|jgi:glycosyltransferase involved in cell wall biosynthesis|nr:glycosyltransferase family 4 protein [Bacteroidales bacterium]